MTPKTRIIPHQSFSIRAELSLTHCITVLSLGTSPIRSQIPSQRLSISLLIRVASSALSLRYLAKSFRCFSIETFNSLTSRQRVSRLASMRSWCLQNSTNFSLVIIAGVCIGLLVILFYYTYHLLRYIFS